MGRFERGGIFSSTAQSTESQGLKAVGAKQRITGREQACLYRPPSTDSACDEAISYLFFNSMQPQSITSVNRR
jgi:hypothetical protein